MERFHLAICLVQKHFSPVCTGSNQSDEGAITKGCTDKVLDWSTGLDMTSLPPIVTMVLSTLAVVSTALTPSCGSLPDISLNAAD